MELKRAPTETEQFPRRKENTSFVGCIKQGLSLSYFTQVCFKLWLPNSWLWVYKGDC